MRSMKNVAVFTEDGAFALFFRPHPGGFDSSRVPTPGNLPSKAKKMLMPGGQPGGALGAAGINWCINIRRQIVVLFFLSSFILFYLRLSCCWRLKNRYLSGFWDVSRSINTRNSQTEALNYRQRSETTVQNYVLNFRYPRCFNTPPPAKSKMLIDRTVKKINWANFCTRWLTRDND